MVDEIIKYKDLKFRRNLQFNYLELIMDNENFSDKPNYVKSISNTVEYAISVHPDYLVMNKLETNFRLTEDLFEFTMKTLFSQLKESGIKRIVMLVDETLYNMHYTDIEKVDSYMVAFKTIEDMEGWIIKGKKQTSGISK
jgi:hypothetical protein